MDTNKRPESMKRIDSFELANAFIDEQVKLVREQVGDKKVLLALSGGVDSSVVAALLIKAIGKQLVCVHVNHGLMRKGESEQVIEVFKEGLDANLVYVDASERFLTKLEHISKQCNLDIGRYIGEVLKSSCHTCRIGIICIYNQGIALGLGHL